VPAGNLEIQSLNRIRRSSKNPCKTDRTLSNIEKQILFSLSYTPKTIEEISEDTMVDQIQLIELLSMMELEGFIRTHPGGRLAAVIYPA